MKSISQRPNSKRLWFFSAFFLLGLLGLTAFTTPTCQPPTTIQKDFLGDLLIGSYYKDLVIKGDIAYGANRYGLIMFNIADWTKPQVLGWAPTPGYSQAVAVNENIVYVADGLNGFRIFDTIKPEKIIDVSSWATENNSQSLVFRQGLLYLADGAGGLKIFDVNDPKNPTLLGSFDTDGDVSDVKLINNMAYLADGSGGLRIVNIENPAAVTAIFQKTYSDPVTGITLDGAKAYLALGTGGIKILNIEDPANPLTYGGLDTVGDVHRIKISGDFAYVAASYGGLLILNVANPSNPYQVGKYDIDAYGQNIIDAVEIKGSKVFIGDRRGRFVGLDVTNPAAVVEAGAKEYIGRLSDIDAYAEYALITDYTQGIHVVNLTNPTSPKILGSVEIKNAGQTVVNGDYAYVTNETGITTVNLTDPANLKIEGTNQTEGKSVASTMFGNYLYVADANDGRRTAGLRIFDITVPFQPSLKGSLKLLSASLVTDVACLGPVVFIVTNDPVTGMYMIETTDPVNPTLIGGADVDQANGIALRGKYAFTASASGMLVFDVTNPGIPLQVAKYETKEAAREIEISGYYAYLAVGGDGLHVINIENPEKPVLEYRFDTPSEAVASAIGLSARAYMLVGDTLDLTIFRFPLDESTIQLPTRVAP